MDSRRSVKIEVLAVACCLAVLLVMTLVGKAPTVEFADVSGNTIWTDYAIKGNVTLGDGISRGHVLNGDLRVTSGAIFGTALSDSARPVYALQLETSGTTGRVDIMLKFNDANMQSSDFIWSSTAGSLRRDGLLLAYSGRHITNTMSTVYQPYASAGDLDLQFQADAAARVVKFRKATGAGFTTATTEGIWKIRSTWPRAIYVSRAASPNHAYTAGTHYEQVIVTTNTTEIKIVLPSLATSRDQQSATTASCAVYTIVRGGTAAVDIVPETGDAIADIGGLVSSQTIGTIWQSKTYQAMPSSNTGGKWIVTAHTD